MPNEGNIRINGGEHFFYKLPAGQWADFGIIAYGYEPSDEKAITNVKVAGGYSVPVVSGRDIMVKFKMSETDKTHLDMVDTLSGKTGEIYIYDGVVDDNHIAIYAPAALIIVSRKDKEGDSPRGLEVTLTFKRQPANISVLDTALPATGTPKPPAGTYTGQNKFYANIQWTITP